MSKLKSLAIDTETTGLDRFHGCRAFVITTCDEKKRDPQVWWEVPVNPFTRACKFSKRELAEVKDRLLSHDLWYFQNPVFDIGFLVDAGCEWVTDYWDRIRDVGLASHLIHSGHKPRTLESIALRHLGIDLLEIETRLKKEVQRAQGQARRKFPEWRVVTASKKDPMLPSGGGWKADIWLLKHMARRLKLPKDHPWWVLGEEYYNADSAVTLPLGKKLEAIIRELKLWKIYKKRLELIPVNYVMEYKGITMSSERTFDQKDKFDKESKRLGRRCVSLARKVGAELELPKSGVNDSLRDTVFNHFALPAIARSEKTGEPSLNKKVLVSYLSTLDQDTPAWKFVNNLSEKRSRDTASGTYITGYIRAWLPAWPGAVDENGVGWYVLHPSLNPTGTGTLRWSSSNPNEQNISKKENFNLRYCFGPAPGREWWSLDAQNIELRIPGYESGEPELIDLFERPNDPPYYGSEHILNFSTVYPDIWQDAVDRVGLDNAGPFVKKEYASTWYQRCKNGGFAVGYGAVEYEGGTADQAFGRPGSHAKLQTRFANKEKLNRKYIEYANLHGYVETLPDKDVDPLRGYPLEVFSKEKHFSKSGKVKPTIPLNYHVQGSAMWWMCMAMIRCHNYFNKLNFERYRKSTLQLIKLHRMGKMLHKGFFLIMQVHDEIVLDFPKGRGSKPWKTNLSVIREVKRLMELGGEGIGVPTPVSVSYHPKHWSEDVSITL